MYLRNLLTEYGYNPEKVLALRHSHKDSPKIRELLPKLVVSRPELFNALQRWQFNKTVEDRFIKADYIAAFIGNEEYLFGDKNRAVFAGLYKRLEWEELTNSQVSKHKDALALKKLGADDHSFVPPRETLLRFKLRLENNFTDKYQGKLVVEWPNPIAWHQFAVTPQNPKKFPISAILPSNSFQEQMPDWDKLVVPWTELKILPETWRRSLSDWKGIYLITDKSDGKAYVGAAYGKDGILQRWTDYKKTADGGNTGLKRRDPNNFVFTILARLSTDMEKDEVLDREESWKIRLHTRKLGLNEN